MGLTTEYLQAFHQKAKDLLTPWMVKAIHDAAKPSSGGKARHRTFNVPGANEEEDNTSATFGSETKKSDLDDLLAQLGLLIDPDGDGIPDALDPDDQQTDLPDDEDLGDGRLEPEDAAEVALRALWRYYMRTHYPPMDGDGDFDYDSYGPDEGMRANMVEFAEDGVEKAVRFWKAEGEAEQIVYGVVLVPDQVDSQGDIVDADEIEAAAHKFLVQYRESGIQHVGDALPSLEVIESYIAPCDMEVGGNPVPKGAWVMAVKINDPEIWQMVLDGTLTGFSIQGYAISEPAEEQAA